MESKLEGLERKTVECIFHSIIQFCPVAFKEACHFHPQFANGMAEDKNFSDC